MPFFSGGGSPATTYPNVVASYNHTGKTAAITNAINYTPPASVGVYKLFIALTTSASGASTSIGVNVTYANAGGAVTLSLAGPNYLTWFNAATGLFSTSPIGNIGNDDIAFFLPILIVTDNSATAITVSTSGTFTNTTYDLAVTLERLV